MADSKIDILIDLAVKNKGAIKSLQNDLGGLNSKSQGTNMTMGKMALAFGGAQIAIGALSKAIGFATGAVSSFVTEAGAMINEAADVERQFKTLELISGRLGFAQGGAADAANRLGKELGIGVGGAAESLQRLFKSGLNIEQSEEMLRRFTNEALTGKTPTMELGDAVMNLASGYQMNNSMLMEKAGISENISALLQKQADKEGLVLAALGESATEQLKYRAFMELTNQTLGASDALKDNLLIKESLMNQKLADSRIKMGEMLSPIKEVGIAMTGLKAEAMDKLVSGLSDLYNNNEDIRFIVKYVQEALQDLGSYISENLLGFIGGFTKGVGENTDGLKVLSNIVVESIVPNLKALIDKFIGGEEGGRNFAAGLIDGAQKAMSFLDMVLKVINGIKDLTDWFSSVNKKAEEFTQTLMGLGAKLYSAGVNAIQGFLNGMKAKWTAVTGWATSAVSGLTDSVKSVLGIRSPSRVFMAIGENVMKGFSNGMENKYSGILSSVSGFMSKVIGNVTSGSNEIAKVLSNTAGRHNMSDIGSLGAKSVSSNSEFENLIRKFAQGQDIFGQTGNRGDVASGASVLEKMIRKSGDYANMSSDKQSQLLGFLNQFQFSGSGFQNKNLVNPDWIKADNALKQILSTPYSAPQQAGVGGGSGSGNQPTIIRSIRFDKIFDNVTFTPGTNADSLAQNVIDSLIRKLELNIY